ncbi:hypothetical protein B0H19DRAFT_1290529 [Mycena capillaripes]|nr:hypothetical protein B0H19DRAFT_1290529 [Mycena capillaripes]
MASAATETHLVSTIESTADEWAQDTFHVLDAHQPRTPGEMGPPIVGSWVEHPEHATVNGGGEGKTQLATAKGLPRGMVQCLPSTSASAPMDETQFIPDLAPPHPPFLTNANADSGTTGRGITNLSTEAQAGSFREPFSASASPPPVSASARSMFVADNLSITVPTGHTDSLHPVAPLSPPLPETNAPSSPPASKFVESFVTPTPTPNFESESEDALLSSGGTYVSSPSPVIQAEESSEEDGGEGKKPRLIQRLKEKIHVGHSP